MDAFKGLIQKWWFEFAVQGFPDFQLVNKLKLLRNKLKEWSRTNLGELVNKKNSLLNELTELDQIQDNRQLNEDEMMIRATVMVEPEELAKNEETSWRQKSRVLWLKQGIKTLNSFREWLLLIKEKIP